MRHIVVCALALALILLIPAATPSRAAASPPLAVRVAAAGTVTVADAQLVAAGWAQPIPRDRVTLTHRNTILPLADTGSGFAFIGAINESRWSSESVYWFVIGDTVAPRTVLAPRLSVPLAWGPDQRYERHQITARGDAWWAGELRGDATIRADLEPIHRLAAPARLIDRADERKA